MVTVNAVLPSQLSGECCDFCLKPADQLRFLVHSEDHTSFICNYCVISFSKLVMQFDILRFMPPPEYPN